MVKSFDRLLIIDVESTCWTGQPPGDAESEIIEIGIALLDLASGEPLSKDSLLVKPERSTVSPFCKELTTLTQAQVEGGFFFKDACRTLERQYQSRSRLWASYGDYDRRQFERQCRSRQVRYPFGISHLNIKVLCAALLGWSAPVGMDEALQRLGLPLEGTHHRGGDDAWNIAKIVSKLMQATRSL